MAQVIWTEPALNDLDAIGEYIAVDNRDAASRLVKRVFAHVEMLAQHPEFGPRIPELLPGSRYRQIVEPPCRVFYRHDKSSQTVFILGVMRGEKLFQKRLLQRRSEPTRIRPPEHR
jgi:plasmid stabilization system protein ParE